VSGLVALNDEQYDVARSLFNEGLECSERMASATGVQLIELHQMGYLLLGLAAVARQQGQDAEAGALVDQGFPIALKYSDRALLGMFMDLYAGLAGAVGQHERAICLEGAADALREAAGAPHSPAWQRMLDQWVRVSHEALSRDAASAAWATGRAMALDDVLALVQAPSPQTPATPDLGPLTPREREVAALVAQGLSNRQIAQQLVITERTAAAHIEHILDKLSFSSRTQIGVWAAHHHPIESSPV
jgi:DNA-binding CsgD family transcriptional regulator